MANYFPPPTTFPDVFDSDYTLYIARNTVETRLASDNQALSDEIEIVPVPADAEEIWPDNGFATIEGELVYYDAVGRDGSGKVNLLRRCARNYGGSPSKFNRSGTWIRGFVVADHHNQLARAIIKTEEFIGYDLLDGEVIGEDSSNFGTLTYKADVLESVPVIHDDWNCPEINFIFDIVEESPSAGILARYDVQIAGAITDFRLDFGDGTFTTSDQTGTHRYAPNSVVSPTVTVSNTQCTTIQSPIERSNPDEPQQATEAQPFDIIIPAITQVPEFISPEIIDTPGEMEVAPLILPCLDVEQFPSISIGDIGPIIVPSVIDITGIPSYISIDPINIPSSISIDLVPPPEFPAIEFGPVPEIPPIDVNIEIGIDAGDIPSCISVGCDGTEISVNWGAPPTLNIAFVSPIRSQSIRQRPSFNSEIAAELGEDYTSLFEGDDWDNSFHIEYEPVGIPSEIKMMAPDFSGAKITYDGPSEIKLVPVDIPSEIKIIGPDQALPSEIKLIGEIPEEIRIVGTPIPTMISVESDIPESIRVDATDIPKVISIDGSTIPEKIQVFGFPESIELKAPVSIPLVLPEDLEIPLVYKGPETLNVKIELDAAKIMGVGDDDDSPCFKFIPCNKR